MRRPQSVRGSLWYIGGKRKKRRQRGEMFSIRALTAPILGTLDRVVVKKLFGSRRRRRRWGQYVQRRNIVKTKSYTATHDITQQTVFFSEIQKSKLKKLTLKYHHKKKPNNRTKTTKKT